MFVQRVLDETYGVECTAPSCRRLPEEGGLRLQQSSFQPVKSKQPTEKNSMTASATANGDGAPR